MTVKRFTTKNIICSNYCVWDNNDKPYGNDEVVELLNELAEEKEQLQSRINDYDKALKTLQDLCERKLKENEQLKQYKQSVNDILLSWSQKNLIAKQLQIVIAIMEELNVMGDEND